MPGGLLPILAENGRKSFVVCWGVRKGGGVVSLLWAQRSMLWKRRVLRLTWITCWSSKETSVLRVDILPLEILE